MKKWNVKTFSKRYGMRAYEAYIEALLKDGIEWKEDEDSLCIRVYISAEEES